MPKKDNDPLKRDNTEIEKMRRRWPNASDDEILDLLSQWTEELDDLEEEDKNRDGKA